jgi:large subunit ribosomal protein L15
MNLSDLRPPKGAKHKRKRVGRGPGSGHGKTAGRGEKGQLSRTGYSSKRAFEGGQMPLVRRVPKRGFTNIFRKEFAVVNLERLAELEGAEFTPESLLAARVVRKLGAGLKVLGEGEISRAVTVSAHRFSKSAKEKIEAAGGKVIVLEAGSQAASEA